MDVQLLYIHVHIHVYLHLVMNECSHECRTTYTTCNIVYGLLAKCEVKMVGYWPSFFCVFIDQDEVEVHINTQKKNEANIPPS